MKWRANRRTSTLRAVGGHLTAGDGRLRFEPNRVDRALAAGAWEVRLEDVTAIDTAPVAFGDFFSGGLRRRLRVQTADGEELFVVSKAEDVAQQLRALLA